MFYRTLLSLCLLSGTQAFAQNESRIPVDRLNQLIDGGLSTIIRNQERDDDIPRHWKGEWSSIKQNIRPILYLGPKGKGAHDSNCFTTGHIHNELAEYALRNPKDIQKLAPTLNLAFDNILTFKSDKEEFSFWHRLPLTEEMKKFVDPKFHSIEVYRPNQYPLTNNFTARRAHVPTDADDTSLAYTAHSLRKTLSEKYPDLIAAPQFSPKFEVFEEYRDLNRNRVHPINYFVGHFRNTGAFVTWLSHREEGFIKGMDIDWDPTPRIPFSVNDIDCVVNANVLQSLARNGQRTTAGAESACRYIDDAVTKGLSKRCGFYYPNPYYLHFAVAKAYDAGMECLRAPAEKLFAELKKEQDTQGHWGYHKPPSNDRSLYLEEPVSATIYGLNAFILYSRKLSKNNTDFIRIHLAANYIADHAQINSDGSVNWNAGAFFSGGGFVRRVLIWTSTYYTTMLGINALDLYRHAVYDPTPNQKAL